MRRSFIVRVIATVTKDIVCEGEGLTEERARLAPFEYAESETEVEQTDFEVRSVKPNE